VPARQDEFERIALPLTRGLLGFARRLGLPNGSAEDLVQSTLLQAWRKFNQFGPETNMRAWLYRILIHLHYEQARRARRRPVTISFMETGRQAPGTGRDSRIEESLEVREALDRLPAEQRTVILLAVTEGFTCREIAEILAVPIGTVMSRMSRGRQALREELLAEPRGIGQEIR